MTRFTESERAAADYFSAQGIQCDRIPESNVPTPDYKLSVGPESVIVEVKEFGRSGKSRQGGYCPVPFVNRKIKAARRQFESHRDQSCCLMLYNAASSTVFLQPVLILCSMFGENFETLGPDSYRFSGIAAMGPTGNTTISAVVGLLPLRVYRNCVEAGRRVFELTGGFGRPLTEDETLQVHRETSQYLDQVESLMRAVVVENPYASKPLPETVFNGPYDECWARVDDGGVRLKRSGAYVAEMRALLPEYSLKMMGLW